MSTSEIEVVLDIREWSPGITQSDGFQELWTLIEGVLIGRDLSSRPVHSLTHADGTVHLTVARIPAQVSPIVGAGSRFQIVAVLERPRIQYRCAACAGERRTEYGPFLCRECDGDQARLCDRHARILDGALTVTCERHRPGCVECGRAATFRCAGAACRRDRAHCDAHRVVHPHDPDHAYCPSCYEQLFPRCEVASCRNIGSGQCELVDDALGPCGRRACAIHLRRWQVFGGEALGLGLCTQHARYLDGLSASEVVRQLVAGTYLRSTRQRRSEPLPSLAGFAHTLRLRHHRELALDTAAIYQVLERLEDGFAARPGREKLRAMMRERRLGNDNDRAERRKPWVKEKKDSEAHDVAGRQLVAYLRTLVGSTLRYDADLVAGSITLAQYKPPRTVRGESRRGLLFVNVPEPYQGGFIGARGANIRYFSDALSARVPGGVDVRIEGERRGGRR